MKTLPALAFLAAFIAFVLLPLPFETAGSVLCVAALLAIANRDYTRAHLPLQVAAPPAAAVTVPQHSERLGLAA